MSTSFLVRPRRPSPWPTERALSPRRSGGLSHVYFPTSGMISLTVLMENGKEVEAGTVGNEGMIGLSVAHGLDFSPTKAISQISGEGLRIPVSAFLKAMKPGGTLDKLVQRYAAFSLRYGIRRSPATCCIRWNSGCAGGYSCAVTGWRKMISC